MKIQRYGSIELNPDDTAGKLLLKVDFVCDEARATLAREPRNPFGAPGRLSVHFVSPGRFTTFEKASKKVLNHGEKRHLTIRELLSLNLYDPMIRSRFPVISGDFVLDYEILDREDGDTVVINRKWILVTSSFYRSNVLPRGTVFAMTTVPVSTTKLLMG
jgi:hypothetical protein